MGKGSSKKEIKIEVVTNILNEDQEGRKLKRERGGRGETARERRKRERER